MKKSLLSVLFLAVVAAVAGLAITFVNDLTGPVIELNAAREEKAELEHIFPGADFKEIDGYTENDCILAVYEVKDKGYIVKATAYGYNTSSPIIVLVAFDEEGKTVALSPLSQQETSGYGSNCFEEDFIGSTYVGKTENDVIDVYSGATRTSEAMRKIMAAAFRAVQEVR
ncbi:MAG: FMN-binding protein [Erysipelotrichaceae bacterium]|nr:FMN-binding protein [Erysipelotrichaceae bacterium]MBR3227137.1 FMN-binding protein [Erysipelotrichaceae bacterium]